METKINVAEARVSGDWCNIKTPEGKEMSIMISKCPKLKAQIEGKVVPFEIEGKVVAKGDKTYVWDLDEKKGGKGAPRNEKAIIAQSSVSSAVQFAQKADLDRKETLDFAEEIFKWVCEKGGVS
jgi:hypothetical protein